MTTPQPGPRPRPTTGDLFSALRDATRDTGTWLRGRVRGIVPGVAVARTYVRGWLRPDLIAAVTIFAILVPQALAYAELAGVSPVAGLYCAIGALVGYAIFGSSRLLVVGPESASAILVAGALAPITVGFSPAQYAAYAAGLAIVVGLMLVLGGLAGIGFMADFLSKPVLTGFLIGAALIIIGSQLGKLTGVLIDATSFVGQVLEFVGELGDISWLTVAWALAFAALYAAIARYLPGAPVGLTVLVVATAASFALDLETKGIAVVGPVPAGLPSIQLPLDTPGRLATLLPAGFSAALIVFVTSVLTARAFGAKAHQEVDANQELIGLGMANLGAGLVQGFPASGSQSRTLVNEQAGGKTQLVGLAAAGLCVVFLLFLTPLIAPLPTAALGVVVVAAAVNLVQIRPIQRLYGVRRTEAVLATVTLAGVLLFGILEGIVVAVVLSVILLVSRIARPNDAVLGTIEGVDGYHGIDPAVAIESEPGLIVYRFDAPLLFANATFFAARVRELVASDPEVEWFILSAEGITDIDTTGLEALITLRSELAGRGIRFVVARVSGRLRAILERAGVMSELGPGDIYPTVRAAVGAFRARDPNAATNSRGSQEP